MTKRNHPIGWFLFGFLSWVWQSDTSANERSEFDGAAIGCDLTANERSVFDGATVGGDCCRLVRAQQGEPEKTP